MGNKTCSERLDEFVTAPLDELSDEYLNETFLAEQKVVRKVSDAFFRKIIPQEDACARINFLIGFTTLFTAEELEYALTCLFRGARSDFHSEFVYLEKLYTCMDPKTRADILCKLCQKFEQTYGEFFQCYILQHLDTLIRTDNHQGIPLDILTRMHHMWAYQRISDIRIRAELAVDPEELARTVGTGAKGMLKELAQEAAQEQTFGCAQAILTQATKCVHDQVEESVQQVHENLGQFKQTYQDQITQLAQTVKDLSEQVGLLTVKLKNVTDQLEAKSEKIEDAPDTPSTEPKRRASRWGSVQKLVTKS